MSKLKKLPGGMMLMPVDTSDGKCGECATKHEPEMPHNQQSLAYQYHFYADHGRWPTWDDAMSHCTDEMKSYWRKSLAEKGIKTNE